MAENPRTSFRSLLNVSGDETSPSSVTFKVTTGVPGFSAFDEIAFVATITGGTGGPLDVIIEDSSDGANWYEFAHFTQVGAATTASYRYSPVRNDNIVQVGKNNLTGSTLTTTMVLTAGSVAGGRWQDQLRVRYVAGASTSAGATQAVGVICYRSPGS